MRHGTPSTYNNHKCRCDECRIAWNAYSAPRLKAYRAKHKAPRKDRTTLDRKSMRAQYGRLQIIQKDKCGICDVKLSDGRRLDVDHDYQTGKVRGLLCRKCNTGLGKFNDSVDILRRALSYLDKPPAK